MTEKQSERQDEVWVFGGSRVGDDNKRWHAWLPVGADGELYFDAKGSYVVGCEYRVAVFSDRRAHHPPRAANLPPATRR
jgi:hypothetical protein